MADVRGEIYEAYKIPIYNYFYKAILNVHTAEDLTEDTFLKAFKYFASFKGESMVKTWLFKIARNTLIDYFKSPYKFTADITEFDIAVPQDMISAANERIIIKQVMYGLDEEERSFIILRDVNGLSYAEIAQIMNCTEGKVKIGIHRSRKKFKELYEFQCKEGVKNEIGLRGR